MLPMLETSAGMFHVGRVRYPDIFGFAIDSAEFRYIWI